jgi:hypothetical protein
MTATNYSHGWNRRPEAAVRNERALPERLQELWRHNLLAQEQSRQALPHRQRDRPPCLPPMHRDSADTTATNTANNGTGTARAEAAYRSQLGGTGHAPGEACPRTV